MDQVRICIVTETYAPEVNGVANTLGYLVKGLRERGLLAQIVRPRQHRGDIGPVSAQEQHFTFNGLPIPGYPELKFGLPAQYRLEKIWSMYRPTAIYVATEGPLGWSAVRAAKKLGIPVVSGFHTNFQSYSNFYRVGWLENLIMAYLRFIHNQTLATLVPTQTQQSWLTDESFNNVKVMSRGVNNELFSPSRRNEALRRSWGIKGDERAFIYVGRIAAEKNIKLAIEAFSRLYAQYPQHKYILVGDGPVKNSLEKAHPEFTFAGMKTGVELAEHFASGDVFLFPSKTETFGNVVTEAMASGLAIVSFDDAAAREHLVHEQSALLSALDDDKGFVENAKRLAKDTSLLDQLREQSYRISQPLSWDNIVEQFLSALLADSNGGTVDEYAEGIKLAS